MISPNSFEGGNLAPLKIKILDLENDLHISRHLVGKLSRDNAALVRRRDDLLEANSRLLERARRAERRQFDLAAYVVVGICAGLILSAVVVGGAL